MIQLIRTISNPLTIVAVFAVLVEICGTVTIGFVAEGERLQVVWAMLAFASFLVACFFLTLNFNQTALFAPTDFRNEDNYTALRGYAVASGVGRVEETLDSLESALTSRDTSADQKVMELTGELARLKDQVYALSTSAQTLVEEVEWPRLKGLTKSQRITLHHLTEPLSPTELATRVGYNSKILGHAVNGLVDRKLISISGDGKFVRNPELSSFDPLYEY